MGVFLITIAVVFELLFSMPVFSRFFLSVVFVLTFLIYTAIDLHKKKAILKIHVLEANILLCFLLYQLLKRENYLFYYILSKISGGFSAFVGLLIGKPISMGITYSGIDVMVLFLISSGAALLYKKLTLKKYLLCSLVMAAIWGFYIGLWTYLAESSIELGLNLLEPVTGPLNYQCLLFAMLLTFYMHIYRRQANDGEIGELNKIQKLSPAVLLAVLCATASVYGLSSPAPVKYEGKQIVFLDTGIDFSVPEHGKYGLDYAGMFGILPHYLNLQGYRCLTLQGLNESVLKEADVLVVFNPMYSLDDSTLSEVWSFVWNGGSVLAVGDHTGDEQVRLPLNAILKPVDISLNFDSAIPFKSLWTDDFQLRRSPIFNGVSDRQIQMVVGASLEVGINANPMIIGKTGYSDLGDTKNTSDGYLGDMHFNRGERIGDLILAAEASYGAGKFMAFGDTTPFQNTIIPYSYPLVDNIFAYLSENGKRREAQSQSDDFFKASCLVDANHLETFARDKSTNAADGLLACLMRGRFMPYLNQNKPPAERLDEKEGVKLLILMEPAAAFSETEVEAMERFMEKGGMIILCAGYESPKASIDLAARFGFSFDTLPIGRIAPDKNPDMAFWNACPVLYEGVSPLDSGDVESIMEIWGNSTIVYKPVGTGGLYVFADPDFLENKNLESVETYREGNVLFLDALLTDILEGRR